MKITIKPSSGFRVLNKQAKADREAEQVRRAIVRDLLAEEVEGETTPIAASRSLGRRPKRAKRVRTVAITRPIMIGRSAVKPLGARNG